MLTADAHVHSEWSWDTGAPAGLMDQTCSRAVAIGLPAVVFTEHLDLLGWQVSEEETDGEQVFLRQYVNAAGTLEPPPFDRDGYRDCVDRCRAAYPELAIHTGVEFGQPHRSAAAASLDLSELDRVNGSLHLLPVGEEFFEPSGLYELWPAEKVVGEYLAEVPRMVAGSDDFAVFTHIDYAVRYWPTSQAGPFDPCAFEEEFHEAMRAIADAGRALEINVADGLRPWIAQWWRDVGGRHVSFGSDAHRPDRLATRFPEAMAMLESFGYRPGSDPIDFWTR